MTTTNSTTPEDNSFDLLFVIDCTGSMGAWMNQAKENILAVYELVQKDLRILFGENNSKLRTGVVGYRDFNGDGSETPNQFEVLDLNDDAPKTKAFLMALNPDGGADFPEDVAGGLEIAVSKISWSAKYKLLIHVADAPAHGKAYCDSGDSFPNGHPKRKELCETVTELAKMGIFYTLFHITDHTKKMGSAFEKVYESSASTTTATEKAPNAIRALYRGLKIVGDSTEFFSFVMQSVRGVLNENGAVTLASTGSKPLDLFNKTVRGVPEEQLLTLLNEAWEEDALSTLKIIFYSRDVRGGKGERKIFETAMNWLIKKHPEAFLKNLELIPEYGRWDDLVRLLSTTDEKISAQICQFIAKTLKDDVEKMKAAKSVSLCAKWAPTEGGKFDKTNKAVKKICAALGINKKQYRKEYMAPLRAYMQIIERFMCAKEWNKINYDAVPSVAMHKLKKAFAKNDIERFNEFKQKLQKGEAKVNSATLHPHMIVEKYLKGSAEDVVAEEQWKGIVKKTAELGSLKRTLVLSDVSASMTGEPMNVSIALGILISELSQPPFQNLVITFEENPKFHALTPGASLYNRLQSLKQSSWGPGTDFMAVFDLILTKALEQQLSQSEMPDRVIVISDMQFNLSGRKTNFEAVKEKFQSYGYEMPKLVFWNTRGDTKDFTNSATDSNVAMVAGFSPSILQAVIQDSDEFTPISIMRRALDAERYKKIELAN